MISIVELEERMTNASILGIIISKLHHGKKPCSIILLEIDKNLKISFYCAILLFGLIVCLWMEIGRKSSLNTKKIT